MRSKGDRPTNDELLAQLDDLGVGNAPDESAPKPTSSAPTPDATQSEKDPLAELSDLASQRPRSTDSKSPSKTSKATTVVTPASSQSSEEKERPAVVRESHFFHIRGRMLMKIILSRRRKPQRQMKPRNRVVAVGLVVSLQQPVLL